MAATEQSTRASAALDDLYRRHVGDVYRYTYAVLGNHSDAEDVTQTTFVNALRALERGEQPREPSNWLLAIAHNLVRQRWRQAAARPTEIELVGDVAAGVPDEEIELDGLVKALQRIPPAQREALVMRELEGRSYQEISELLGVTNSALETLLFRARRSLADELENLVTCQSAELAMSQGLDGRLSRKERRRLKEHLDECASCARLAEMQGKQRRAFKGLALLPLPIALTLFKGAPAATAAVGVPTIGVAGAGGAGARRVRPARRVSAQRASASAGAAGAAGAGSAVGGSLVGGAVAKVAAVVVAATVATGAGYEGLNMIRADTPEPTRKQVQRTGNASPKSTRPRAVTATSRSSVGARIAPASASSQTRTARGVDAPKDVSESAARTSGPHSAAASGEPSVKPSVGPSVEPSSSPLSSPRETESDTPTGHDGGRVSTPETPSAGTPPLVVPTGDAARHTDHHRRAERGDRRPRRPPRRRADARDRERAPAAAQGAASRTATTSGRCRRTPAPSRTKVVHADDKPVKDAADTGKPAKP